MSAGRKYARAANTTSGVQEQAVIACLLALNTLFTCAGDGGPDYNGIVLSTSAIHDICNNMQMLAGIETEDVRFPADHSHKITSVQDHLVRVRYSEPGKALQNCLQPGLS